MPVTVVEQNVEALAQGIALLQAISDDDYRAVGPHLRHAIEFYDSFLDGYQRQRVDYDARARRGDLETDRRVAHDTLEGLAARCGELHSLPLTSAIEVRLDAPDAAPETAWSRSTVHRELQFLLSHTVHHYALVGLLLESRGVRAPEEFGVAPSTLAARRAGSAGARKSGRPCPASGD